MIEPGELIWTIMGTIGLLVHSILCYKDMADVRLAIASGAYEEDIFVGKSNVRRQAVYGVVQACAVGLGLLAMGSPPNPRDPSTVSVIGSLVIIGMEVLLMMNGIADYRGKERLAYLVWRRRYASSNTKAS